MDREEKIRIFLSQVSEAKGAVGIIFSPGKHIASYVPGITLDIHRWGCGVRANAPELHELATGLMQGGGNDVGTGLTQRIPTFFTTPRKAPAAYHNLELRQARPQSQAEITGLGQATRR
jgi:hypothetical protein